MQIMLNGLKVMLALGVVLLGLIGTAESAVVVQSAERGLNGFTAATDDLINLGTATLSSQINSGSSNFGSDATGIGLNNGTIYNGNSAGNTVGGNTYCPANNSSITFDLDLAGQPAGYDIGAISSISGGSQNRRSQKFSLAVSTVGDPGFTTIADQNQVNFTSTGTNGEMRVTVRDDAGGPLATGVDQVRVTYFDLASPAPEAISMYRELDVFAYSAPPVVPPTTTGANLTAHFDASNLNGGLPQPVDGTEINDWTDLVSGLTVNNNAPSDGKPTFIADGIGGRPTVRFDATGAGGDLLFNNTINFDAQTIFAVATMADNSAVLATMIADGANSKDIRQTTTATAGYYSGNSADFLKQNSTAADGGTIRINGDPRLDIPGGFDSPHVLKAERTTATTYSGFRFSSNQVSDRRWNGDIAEILAFDATLSGDDTLKVRNYLTDKYGISFTAPLNERINESKQIALDPFFGRSVDQTAVNFHYTDGTTAGSFEGIDFVDIDVRAADTTTPIDLGDGKTMTWNTLPNTAVAHKRDQNAGITGVDAATLNTVLNEIFYIGGTTTADMTFAGLMSNADIFVQVLGGNDDTWISDVQILVNGTETIDWLGVGDGGRVDSASMLGFYTMTDDLGQLQLNFSVSGGNYAGIGGIIISQVPEPSTFVLAALGLVGLGLLRRRRRK